MNLLLALNVKIPFATQAKVSHTNLQPLTQPWQNSEQISELLRKPFVFAFQKLVKSLINFLRSFGRLCQVLERFMCILSLHIKLRLSLCEGRTFLCFTYVSFSLRLTLVCCFGLCKQRPTLQRIRL